MAAAGKLFSTNIQITQQLRQTKCRSLFSAGVVSCFSGTSKEMGFLRGQNTPSLHFREIVHQNFTRTSSFAAIGENQKANLKHYKTIRTLDRRWISTSTSYFNGDSSVSSGKGKIKERLGKVKETVHRESILTIPNLLSTFRIISAPFLGYFIISEEFMAAVALFGVAGITDMLDGYIARNFKNQKSVFGTILDPVADKVLMSVLAISLTVAELLPIPLTALILGRDFLLVLAAFYFRYKSLPPPKTLSRYFDVNLATVELRPNVLGKANTVLQLGLVGSTLLSPVLGYVDHQFLHVLWYLVGTSTVLSSISYLLSANTAVRYLK